MLTDKSAMLKKQVESLEMVPSESQKLENMALQLQAALDREKQVN